MLHTGDLEAISGNLGVSTKGTILLLKGFLLQIVRLDNAGIYLFRREGCSLYVIKRSD